MPLTVPKAMFRVAVIPAAASAAVLGQSTRPEAATRPATAERPATAPATTPDPARRRPNYDEAMVPPYTLPDPLVCADGTPVTGPPAWRAKRRPEVLETFTTQMYGRVPAEAAAAKSTFVVNAVDPRALDGRATRKLVTVWLLGKAGGPRMDLLVYVPNGRPRPVPAFLGLNFAGNQGVATDPGVPVTSRWVRPNYPGVTNNRATDASRGTQATRWQVEAVLARGYATATAYYGDLEEDHPDGWRNGIRGALKGDGPHGGPPAAGRPAADFRPDEWGAVSAWAWGLSRAMDYLATDPDIDAARVAVHGHSRLGKAALWAGAQDERLAAVVSNDSGEGGASLMRRDFGETIADANAKEPHRFCGNFRRYNDRPADLPVDAHLLLALVAPRPVYVASATEDGTADPRGEFLAARAATPVYRLFGRNGIDPAADMPAADRPVGDVVAYHVRSGKHDMTAYDWARYLDFADRFLARR